MVPLILGNRSLNAEFGFKGRPGVKESRGKCMGVIVGQWKNKMETTI